MLILKNMVNSCVVSFDPQRFYPAAIEKSKIDEIVVVSPVVYPRITLCTTGDT